MSRSFDFSVVTPFHNTELPLFERAVASMRGQSCGYERIQWIVVLHNCEQAYVDGVHALLDGDENVVLLELNNDNHTASSPRNYGMRFATGRYIGFLDSDDSFLPDYGRIVPEAIRRNEAEVAVFRREYEKEDRGLSTVTELVLWDQTRREILLEGEAINDERLFTSAWGLVTSKVFDLDFLRSNDIRFDEDVPMGEDFLFCIEAYARAHRILVMPQFIGYHYMIHGTSILQASTSGERLVAFARGYVKVFGRGLEQGFPMNTTINGHTAIIARKMQSSNSITLAQRIEIRDMLRPFIELTHPITPCKIYSLKQSTDIYEIIHNVILHPELWDGASCRELLMPADSPDEQEGGPAALLQRILERNADTDIGRRYGFANLWTIRAYQTKVPMTDSETYRPWIRLQTHTGESGIFSADPILTYYTDFDEGGSPMLFPCAESAMRQYEEQMERVLKGRITFLNMECLPGSGSYNDQAAGESLYAMFLRQYYARVYPRLRGTGTQLTAPQALFFPPEAADTRYARLLFALRQRDTELIWSPNAWELLDMFEYLEHVWPELCDDIEKGRVSAVSGLSAEFRKELDMYLQPDPERAEELRRILAQGFDVPVVPQLWKALRLIIAGGGGDYTMYGDHLSLYTGSVPRRNGPIIVCGGILGIGTRGFNEYRLDESSCFCEFLPSDGEPVLRDQVEEHRVYEPVLTTLSGLYRFKTGTLIYITGIRDGQIYFRPLTRLYRGVSFENGTMLHVYYLYSPLKALEERYGLRLTDCAFWGDENGITVMPEVSAHTGEAEKARAADPVRMAEQLKEAVEAEQCLTLPPVKLVFSRPGSHMELRLAQAVRLGISPDQIPPTHYISDIEDRDFLLERVL